MQYITLLQGAVDRGDPSLHYRTAAVRTPLDIAALPGTMGSGAPSMHNRTPVGQRSMGILRYSVALQGALGTRGPSIHCRIAGDAMGILL